MLELAPYNHNPQIDEHPFPHGLCQSPARLLESQGFLCCLYDLHNIYKIVASAIDHPITDPKISSETSYYSLTNNHLVEHQKQLMMS